MHELRRVAFVAEGSWTADLLWTGVQQTRAGAGALGDPAGGRAEAHLPPAQSIGRHRPGDDLAPVA